MSTTTQFQVGDQVRLHRYGPIMEVIRIEQSAAGKVYYLECTWVSPKQKSYTDKFRPEEIVLVQSKGKCSIGVSCQGQ